MLSFSASIWMFGHTKFFVLFILLLTVYSTSVVCRDECDSDVEEDVRLSEMAQILEVYQSSNVVSLLCTELYDGQPKNTLEYSRCCAALQYKLLHKYRHFLYITGTFV